MHEQLEEALSRLEALVERILREEEAGKYRDVQKGTEGLFCRFVGKGTWFIQ